MHTILLIDDDAVFLESVAEAMTRCHRDITITTAATAEHGLRLHPMKKMEYGMPLSTEVRMKEKPGRPQIFSPLTEIQSAEKESFSRHFGNRTQEKYICC